MGLIRWRVVAGAVALAGLAPSVAALAAADLGPAWWWCEAFEHPRPQLFAGSLVCAALLLASVRRRWALAALSVPLWALAGMLPALLPGPTSATGTSILSANVYLDNPDRPAAVAALAASDADALVLLEASLPWRPDLEPLRARFPVVCERLRPDAFGLCVYAKRGTADHWDPPSGGPPGIHLAIDGLDVLAIHPPPGIGDEHHRVRSDTLRDLAAWAASRPRAVVIGDWNATPWSSAMRRTLADGRLALAGWHSAKPTWLVGTPLAAPIDHAAVGPALGFADHTTGPHLGSDHRWIRVVVGER